MFMELLKSEYNQDSPIFVTDLKENNAFRDYTDTAIRKNLSRLLKKKELCRFSSGVYYIPKQTLFGNSLLSPKRVIESKYLYDGRLQIGIYGPLSILNKLMLSTQVPNTLEVITNKETNRKRQVKIGSTKLILKKSRAEITSRNAKVFEILEIIPYIDLDNKEVYKKVADYLSDIKLSRQEIDDIALKYSKKTMTSLIGSRLIYDIAS